MKITTSVTWVFLSLALTISLWGCGGGKNKGPSDQEQSLPGTYNIGGVVFKMKQIPNKSFPIGVTDSTTSAGTVDRVYWIGETEVTYELWHKVYIWATTDVGGGKRADGGALYHIYRPGEKGKNGAPENSVQHPVTNIGWRDAIVWCNALTEYYNAYNGSEPDLDCVYYIDSSYNTPLRTSTDDSIDLVSGKEDQPYIKAETPDNIDISNCTAKGFRLPTTGEWELAARYIIDANNDGDICDSEEYYPGTYASGADADTTTDPATTDYDKNGNIRSTGDVAVYNSNSGLSTAPVKSKYPNKLGLYDMSGNVREWCFDWPDSLVGVARSERGGDYSSDTTWVRLASSLASSPILTDNATGFRLGKNE